MDEDAFAEDAARIRALPEKAMTELRAYMENLLAGQENADRVCIWLNKESRQCRFHEHRPSICREFELGSSECVDWRQQYGVT